MPPPLTPPPLVAAGGAPNPPSVVSFLNDYADLRVPAGHTFTSSNSVDLAGVSLEDAFRMLCGPEGAEAVRRAHPPFCREEALPLEPRRVEPERPASTAGYSTVAPLLAALADEHHPAWATLIHFRVQEKVPLLCGLVTKYVRIEAWQIADPAAHLSRYVSNADDGSVLVWKYRWLTPLPAAAAEADGPAGVRVSEYVVGVIATALFRGIAQSECRKMNLKHMQNYSSIDFTPAAQKQQQQQAADHQLPAV